MYWFNLKAQQTLTGLQRDSSVLFFFFFFFSQLITFKQILTLELVGKCQLLFLSCGLALAELAWHLH